MSPGLVTRMSKPHNSDMNRLAVLIDAENMPAKTIEPVLVEVANYGIARVKRAYGDWTTENLGGWKDKLHRFAIQPVQQFRYAKGKNLSDFALVIDAMDLLHSGVFDAFCLVTSDSDFTRLACRIREAGLAVYGFGGKRTLEPFVRACDRFIYVENLIAELSIPATQVSSHSECECLACATALTSGSSNGNSIGGNRKTSPSPVLATGLTVRPAHDALRSMAAAYRATTTEPEWVSLSLLGQNLGKTPSLKVGTYRFRNLSELVIASGIFDIEMRVANVAKKGHKSPELFVKLRDDFPSDPKTDDSDPELAEVDDSLDDSNDTPF
jgi:uncharacterized LabA/DUF88 family protein